MKFDFKTGFKKTSIPNIKQVLGLMGHVWQKIHSTLFFVFLLALIVLGVYIWRQSLYQGGWSEERKQQYLDSQDKGVVFKEDDFKKVISSIQARKEENTEGSQPIKDIFQPYK